MRQRHQGLLRFEQMFGRAEVEGAVAYRLSKRWPDYKAFAGLRKNLNKSMRLLHSQLRCLYSCRWQYPLLHSYWEQEGLAPVSRLLVVVTS